MNGLLHPLIVKKIAWKDEAATQAFARALAASPAVANALIELRGDLGAGKTTFARYLLAALGVASRIKSPTYAVVESYALAAAERPRLVSGAGAASGLSSLSGESLTILHFDFYRFNDPREWEEAGFRDLFASPGLKLVEWAEKAGRYLPPRDLIVSIDVLPDDTRAVEVTALTAVGAELLA